MNHNHPQELLWNLFKNRSDPNLILCLQFIPLNTGHKRVRSQRLMNYMKLIIIPDLTDGAGLPQVLIFQFYGEGIERLVRSIGMGLGVFCLNKTSQSLGIDQLLYLIPKAGRIVA